MFGLPIPSLTAIKWAAIGLSALTLLAGGFYGGIRWEKGALDDLKLADANARTAAVKDAADKQRKIDNGNQADAVAQAYLRGKLDAVVVNFPLEASTNVTVTQDQQAAAAVHAGCITYGFVRMLYAGEHGVPAESLPIPSDESPDTCTAYEPSVLATALAQDLAAGYGNSQQLDSLIAAVKRNDAIVTAAP